MKNTLRLVVCLSLGVAGGCLAAPEGGRIGHADGRYRGVFIDKAEVQVNVEFTLRGNVVTEAKYRLLRYEGIDYLAPELAPDDRVVRGQHEELLAHLVGRDIRGALDELYEPGGIVKTEADAVTGATVRAGKVVSAIRDALNRGVYSK